ncbi:hypothetical protein [Paenibacillus agilis]|uniref:Uncharacterized protein n=1 Tax=Paenibacillus agilis TaxID=3020863 RepID=A0A559ID21_9BACL|nr:hypothetical protein [Paenibacillus agilis]TVX85572.1 hypothetical protein FPZ44_24770 [Paenibacillus agilis]
MEQLFLVEMRDTCLEVSIRVGKHHEILEEVERCAVETEKHSVKVTPIVEVDGYKIIIKKSENEAKSYDQYFEGKLQSNKIQPAYDPRDLLLNLLVEITSNEKNDDELVGSMAKDLVKAFKAIY